MPKTEKVAEGVRELVKQFRANSSLSARAIAKEVGLHHKTVSRILRQETPLDLGVDEPVVCKTPAVGKPEVVETSEVKGDIWTISLPKTRIKTIEELIEDRKIDLSVWFVEKFTCTQWELGMKPPATTEYITTEDGRKIPAWVRFDDEPVIVPLFQVKAWLKRKKEVAAVKNEIEGLKKLARLHPWPSGALYTHTPTGLMLEINTPDLHMGKLAWSVETSGPNYDVKIAEATFWSSFDTLLSRVDGYDFDEVLFVMGNDLLNSDDIEGRTTAGTYVSSDARYHKTFATTRTMVIKAIERLKALAPVKVLPVYGNHDRLSSWHLGDSVEMYFTNDPQVTVDNRPRPRKYHEFGKVMLMLTHGDKGKKSDYPQLMATDEGEMWGRTLFRECHTGHTHMTKLDEQHGVRVRVLPALCPADDWHSQNGFVGNKRSAEAYVWDRNEGLISVVYHTEKD